MLRFIKSLFSPLFKQEVEYEKVCRKRPFLTDEEFIYRYYEKADTHGDVALRVRKVLAKQCGFEKIVPTDRPADIWPDVDLQIFLDEIGEEFSVVLSADDLRGKAGSFDDIVTLVVLRLDGA